LPTGTTVDFPNGIHAVFAPRISQSGRNSWNSLELAALPPSTGIVTPAAVEPDIVVQCDAAGGEVIVIDAKYRARHLVDYALWEVHRKYGRFRRNGVGVVAKVIVAHPHDNLVLRWAGQAALPFVPGGHIDTDIWPGGWMNVATSPQPFAVIGKAPAGDPDPDTPATAQEDGEPQPVGVVEPTTPAEPVPLQQVLLQQPASPSVRIQDVDLVICDQYWTASVLAGRRLDLLSLRMNASVGKPSYLVGSNHGNLGRLHDAAYHRGWNIAVTNERDKFLDKVEELVHRHRPKVVTIISEHSDVIELLRSTGCIVDVMDDIEDLVTR
jgi:hypothetical protein